MVTNFTMHTQITPVQDKSDDLHGPWPACAKLNLMLRILGRRSDGYHELQTVFQFINKWDQLYFRIRTDSQIKRTNGPVAVPEYLDLTVRAAYALKTYTNCPWG